MQRNSTGAVTSFHSNLLIPNRAKMRPPLYVEKENKLQAQLQQIFAEATYNTFKCTSNTQKHICVIPILMQINECGCHSVTSYKCTFYLYKSPLCMNYFEIWQNMHTLLSTGQPSSSSGNINSSLWRTSKSGHNLSRVV